MPVHSEPWAAPPPPPRTSALSALMVSKAYSLVIADPTLLVLVALSALASGLTFAAIAVPAWLIGHVSLDASSVPAVVLSVVAGWASAFVGVLGTGAVVAAGMARLDGTPITAREALAVAWERRRQLAAWALLTTLVVLLERMTERFGIGGMLLRLVTEIGWALATMLVVPIMIRDGAMPVEAVRTSAGLVKDRLGLTIRTIVRFYTPWVIATVISFLVILGGMFAFAHYRHDVPSWAAAGAIVAVLGVIGLFGSIAVQSAAAAYVNTLLYRHAVGLPLPGIDPYHLPALVGDVPPPPAVPGVTG